MPRNIVQARDGNIPVILSAHHDGYMTRIGGDELPRLRNAKNDEGTRALSWTAAEFLARMYEMRPHVIVHRIKKDRSSEKMFTIYIEEIFSLVDRCLDQWGRCYVFDIHCFRRHRPPAGEISREYGVWLGTDHRASIRNDFDRNFAASLLRAFKRYFGPQIDVFVPGSAEKKGERFGATGKQEWRRIITKLVSDRFCGQSVNAIQIEFYKDLLVPERRGGTAIALCEAIAENI